MPATRKVSASISLRLISPGLNFLGLNFLGLAAIAASVSGTAAAQNPYASGEGLLPPDPPPAWIAEGRPVQEWDWLRFDYSGTRGRMGLGASPAHPEGPGNFSVPGW